MTPVTRAEAFDILNVIRRMCCPPKGYFEFDHLKWLINFTESNNSLQASQLLNHFPAMGDEQGQSNNVMFLVIVDK